MAVVIRLKRGGRRNRPHYRITVTDSRFPRDGRIIENLGHYDPIASRDELRLSVDVERAKYWLSHGAQPSETVRSILEREGAFEGREPRKPRDRSGRKATKTRATRRAAQRERDQRRKKPAAVAKKRARERAAAAAAPAAAPASESSES